MELPLKVDLNRLEIPSVAQMISPMVPGVVLSSLVWYFRPQVVEQFFSVTYVGYGTKLLVSFLASYVAGLLVAVFSEVCVGTFAAIFVSTFVRFAANRMETNSWQLPLFRKLGTQILGQFAPPDEQPMSAEEYLLEIDRCTLGVPPLDAVSRKLEVLREKSRRRLIDLEWRQWYGVLRRSYRPSLGSPQASIFAVRAAASGAVAAILVMWIESVSFGLGWAAAWVLLFIGLVQETSILGLSMYPDSSGEYMLAQMLHQARTPTVGGQGSREFGP